VAPAPPPPVFEPAPSAESHSGSEPTTPADAQASTS
jgi:hypothetical protein